MIAVQKENGLTVLTIRDEYGCSWIAISINDRDVITVRSYFEGGYLGLEEELKGNDAIEFMQAFQRYGWD